MDQKTNMRYHVYNDIKERTNGEIYLGVVGPVRTGKSTFIKRFMELLVLPNMKNQAEADRAKDELPQSGSGRMIMTTEPKFVPKDTANILVGDTLMNVRLIDCVGYMVEGASGHMEDDKERMVKTPWFDYKVPFSQAAELGTRKVIHDHATIGIVMMTDGSIGELSFEQYLPAFEKTVQELKKIAKPFVCVLNCSRPYAEETKDLVKKLEDSYRVHVVPVNCEQMKTEDITRILQNVLEEFPISAIYFDIPKWVELLPVSHPMKSKLIALAKDCLNNMSTMKDRDQLILPEEMTFLKRCQISQVNYATGTVHVSVEVEPSIYYQTISDFVGLPITGEYQLMRTLFELANQRLEYQKIKEAMDSVRYKGYGIVTPSRDEIRLEEPVVIKQGNKFGIKMKAEAPSIHLIQADIETEIAPIVGSEEQAQDLIRYINEAANTGNDGIWDTNIFGKSTEQIVEEGIQSKIAQMTEDCQKKMQETLKKIINDSNGGMVCIIL